MLRVAIRSAPRWSLNEHMARVQVRKRWSSGLAARKASDPLKILFCGSEEFSCQSLYALHTEHLRSRKLIESLDVMVRPPKKAGRGLKQVREVPCEVAARSMGLPVHERDTFRGWDLPKGINLVIAVSFGLFVPSRILGAAKYGGLNVHPSMLPHLRGPAPIHHAILRGDSHIGITIQTLDDKAFDHGAILAQTPEPGLPLSPEVSLRGLTLDLAKTGAEMLVQSLRDGLHVPPRVDVSKAVAGDGHIHAPKLGKADSQIDWIDWESKDFSRRMRVFGSVWALALNDKGEVKRILLLDAAVAATTELEGATKEMIISVFEPRGKQHSVVVRYNEATESCFVLACDSTWIRVNRIKVDGKPEQAAATALRPFKSSGYT